jgi:outer membrane lipoprotein-sorting protein
MDIKRKIVRYGIAAIGLSFFIAALGTSNTNGQVLKEILDRMDGNYKALKSLRSNVTMVKVNPQLGTRDIWAGTSNYLAKNGGDPRCVRIDWTKPVENLVVKGDKYQIFRPKMLVAYTGTTDGAKNSGAAGGAFSFISMSKAERQANYLVQYVGQEAIKGGVQTWHIVLTPKKPTSYKSADLWVDQNGMPRMTTITEKNDDTTTVLLESIETNVKIKLSIFSFELPKGVKPQHI